ncbi:MAG: c-type cytochrome [Cytophagales bacterium]|nr:c-type cytochrome [Rhizobacter sp.]
MPCRLFRAAWPCVLMLVSFSLRAAPPVAEDSMAQRVQACTGCHGSQGRAASDGYYPRIAGKPAAYLYHQLLNFRDGRRQYAPMARLIEPLSDAYLQEIAAHFAALELPYAAAQPATAPAETLRRGEALALRGDAAMRIPACVQCHGPALSGLAPAIPGLLGLPRDYLNAQLGAWKTGNRNAQAPDCMAQIAQALTTDDVAALSQWLAAQPLPAQPKAVSALAAPLPLPCGGVSEGQR